MEVILQNKIKPETIKVINNIQFTNRELDVIACILGGRATKKIAFLLDISIKTVENHIHNIMLKIGCSSRERVIDFVEKSEQFSNVKKYYSNLLINVTFETKLKKIATFTTSEKPINLIIYYKEQKKDALIRQLEKHLNLAGIKVRSEVWQNNQINITGDTQLTNYLIYNMSQELTQGIETKGPNTNSLYSLVTSSQGCTISLEVKSGVKPHVISNTFPNVISISLEECENYYSLVFEILKKLLKYDLIQIINEFKKQYKIFLDYSYLPIEEDFLEKELGGTSNSIHWNKKSYFPRKKLSIILLTLISCIGFILNVKNFTTLNSSKYNQPTESIIIEPLVTPLKTWPLQLPFHDNNRFIERAVNNVNYTEMLSNSLNAKEDQLKTLVIYGLGGMGKTQIAKHYIHSKLAANNYKLRVWFPAESQKLLDHSFLEFAKTFGLIKTYSRSMGSVRNIVLNWFETHHNWLIVFDNVVDYASVQSYFPGKGGNILITTRQAIWPATIKTLNITAMQEEEAIKLIQIFSGHETKIIDVELAKRLGYLPLAMAQAASYMQVHDKTTEEYLELYDRCQQELLGKDLHTYGIEHEPILVTWNNSLKSIEGETSQKKETLLAKDFLIMSAYLASEKIPKTILTKLIEINAPGKDAEIIADTIISKLLSHSLIDKENGGKSFNIHRLLQTIIRQQNKNLQMEQTIISRLLDILAQLFIKDARYNKSFEDTCNLLPHIDTILDYSKQYPNDKHIKLQVARLLSVKAYFLTQFGMSIIQKAFLPAELAKQYYEELAGITKNESDSWQSGNEPLETRTRNCAKLLYKKFSNVDLPVKDKELLPVLYAASLYIAGRMHFFTHDQTTAARSLAYLYLSKQLSELIELHTGRKVFYKILAEKDGILCFNNFNNASKEELIKASARYKVLLHESNTYMNEDAQQQYLATDKMHKLGCYRRLIQIYTKLIKEYPQQKYYQKTKNYINNMNKLIAKNLNLERLANHYNTIGEFYLTIKEYKKALVYFTDAKDIEEKKNNGQGKPDYPLADAYYGLADTYLKLKDYKMARKNIANCLKIQEVLYEPNDTLLIKTKDLEATIQRGFVESDFNSKNLFTKVTKLIYGT